MFSLKVKNNLNGKVDWKCVHLRKCSFEMDPNSVPLIKEIKGVYEILNKYGFYSN